MSDRLHLVQGKIDDVIKDAAKGEARRDGPGGHALDGAAASMVLALASLDEITRHIHADIEPAPVTVACAACGKTIRAAATLCGYCWTKR